MAAENTTVCLSFDFDAISVWLGSFGTSTPTAMSRGEFGANVGTPRILDLLEREDVPASWFVLTNGGELIVTADAATFVFDDATDFEDAERGFVASGESVICDDRGEVVWDTAPTRAC